MFEIHILPDPTNYYSALWYFFKVENLPPGEYFFVIVGFFRDAHLHQIGVQPTALSLNGVSKGVGWQRHGSNMNFWCWKKTPAVEYALSFTFSVKSLDTMYFSYLYPYSYSLMRKQISALGPSVRPTVICQTLGGVEFPVILWDADCHRCVNAKKFLLSQRAVSVVCVKKPLIVITARHHPGESNSSYAMDGFLASLFHPDNEDAIRLLNNFSFLIVPMMNPDGVVCGYYRPSLAGYDMNRVWIKPNKKSHPVEYAIINMLDHATRSRKLIFFLDFHGHTAQCNAFTYGVWDEDCPMNELEAVFPKIMASCNHVFDEAGSCSFAVDAYRSTMRVALHNRYQIPFAYTLEMSFGGIDIGASNFTQMTPDTYRSVGESTVKALAEFLLEKIQTAKFSSNCFNHCSSDSRKDSLFL